MIFASVSKGHHLVIENDRVVAEVKRAYKSIGHGFWSDGYILLWNSGKSEKFKTLHDIHNKHNFENYAGYGKILRKNS